MILQAEPASCFSSTFVIKLDDHAIGKIEGRWFGESLEIALLERRRLTFEKVSWLSSHFRLLAEDEPNPIGEATRSGLFTSGWDLTLSIGSAHLVREGWFATAYAIKAGDETLGRVDRIGVCSRGWTVEANGLKEEDLLLIGLVYQTIKKREAAAQSGAAGAGS